MGNFPSGKIAVGEGPRMASADMFRIKVKGAGGHGSMPNYGVDALVAASSIVMNLQTVVSREISPMESAVVSIGKLSSGTRFNVIADEAIMEGTTRCFSYEVREQLPAAMQRIVKSTAASYRAEAEFEYKFLTAPTINNMESTERAKKAIEKIMSRDAVMEMPKMAGSEDFSEYLEMVPGTFAIVGIANKDKDTCYSNHHPMFDIDEDMLVNGVALHAQYAFDYLMNK
jgi:amidohydrolase